LPGRPRERSFLNQFLVFWLPVLAYITVIITLSAQPFLKPPFTFTESDKVAHLVEYGGLGLLLARALRGSLRLSVPAIAALLALLIGALIGAGDEYFQKFVPGRQSSVFDWLADLSGVALAQLIYVMVVRG
jgi:VanZ family protein